MAGLGIALPEPLHGDDAKSWLKRFEVCTAENEWDDAKKLLRAPTLLKGRPWAVYESLSEAETDTYAHLKTKMLARLSPDTAEERLIARKELSRKKFVERRESIDELACCIERLVDKASPGLPANVHSSELQYHLINSLPEKVSGTATQTAAPGKLSIECCQSPGTVTYLWSIYCDRANKSTAGQPQKHKALQQVTEQLATLNQCSSAGNQQKCFACG